MRSWRRALLCGVGVWFVPFVIAIAIYGLHASERALFESLMAVAVVGATVEFATVYLRVVEGRFVREGVLIGVAWFAIAFAIDLLMFSWGPMKMAFVDYVKDIGVTYLVIPTITVGMGIVLQSRAREV